MNVHLVDFQETDQRTHNIVLDDVRFLLPVWGEAYVAQFLDFCLPSLLAEGNIPAIAKRYPSRFIVLTRAADADTMRLHSTWRLLDRVCPIEITFIDDLVSRSAATTLTLAYTRAMRSTGKALDRTAFIYLVADFIVANGAMETALAEIEGGASGVLTGNFIATTDGMAPALSDLRRASDGVLTVEPRKLMNLALQHIHPDSRVCTIAEAPAAAGGGQRTSALPVHDTHANRLFWSVDRDTLVGRFFLLHMFALRPEVQNFIVAAPSDYAFVPELCPNGKLVAIEDSDRLCVIEMQPAATSTAKLRFGSQTPANFAASVGSWATRQHRANALSTLVFHSGLVDPTLLARTKSQADRFVGTTLDALPSKPQPHRQHPYWGRMLDHHFATATAPPDRAAVASMLGHDTAGAPSRYPRPTLGALREAMLGRVPRFRLWHPRWPDWRHLAFALSETCSGKRVHLAEVDGDRLRQALIACLRTAGAIEVIPPPSSQSETASGRRAGIGLLVWPKLGPADLSRRLHALAPLCDEVIVCGCDFTADRGPPYDPASLSALLRTVLDDKIGPKFTLSWCSAIPSTSWRRTVQDELILNAEAVVKGRLATALLKLPVLTLLAPTSAIQNLFARYRSRRTEAIACSSFVALFRVSREAVGHDYGRGLHEI